MAPRPKQPRELSHGEQAILMEIDTGSMTFHTLWARGNKGYQCFTTSSLGGPCDVRQFLEADPASRASPV